MQQIAIIHLPRLIGIGCSSRLHAIHTSHTYLSCHLGLQHMREVVEKSMPWLVWWTSYGSMFDHFQTWRSGTNKPEVVKWLCQRVRELGTEQIPNFLASHRGARLWWRKFGRSMFKASEKSCGQRGAAKLLESGTGRFNFNPVPLWHCVCSCVSREVSRKKSWAGQYGLLDARILQQQELTVPWYAAHDGWKRIWGDATFIHVSIPRRG